VPSTRDLLTDPLRLLGRTAARTPLRLAFFACLSLSATWPLLEHAAQLNEFRDAQVLQHYESVAASSVRAFRQLPLWDPYYCGGMYLLGTPQARFVSPSFLLTLLFGESTGAALTAFGMLILGLEGAFRYARARGALAIGAALAAPIFGLSGVFANAASLAWTNFYGFALVPWIVLGFRRALRFEARGVALAAGGVAWCVGFGGTYAVPLAAVWCGLEALEVVGFGIARRRWRPTAGALGMAILTGSLAAGLGAVRLWPVAETMITAPRVVGGTPGTDLPSVLGMLFLFPKSETQNAGFYIGLSALPPLLLGLRLRRSRPLLVYGFLWAWLAPGYSISVSLFAAMVRLPIFGMLRYPERYLILLALVVSALAAQGVSFAAVLARKGRWQRAGLVTSSVLAAGLLAGAGPMVNQLRNAAAGRDLSGPPLTLDRPFHQARGSRWALAHYAPMQRGSLSCWDAYPVPESPLLQGDLEAEEYLQDPTAGRLTERRWTPNRIDLDVDLERPTRVVVNQNWHRGWRASEGIVESERGLLEVELPAGKRTLSLRFAPRSAEGGALVSIASLLALATLVFLARRARPRFGVALAAGLIPPLAFAIALGTIPEARVEAAPPLAPTGEEIVRDELVEGTVPLDAVFGGGIGLVAATVDNPMPAAGETTHLELDWRRDPAIDEGLGIFVHIEPTKGDRLNGDHFDLSQALSFEAAPPGKLLRDIVPITMPADSSGKRWKIWVGLWRLRRGGGRVPVIRNGSAIVDGNRILAGVVDVR
jgi:hypothetical protein